MKINIFGSKYPKTTRFNFENKITDHVTSDYKIRKKNERTAVLYLPLNFKKRNEETKKTFTPFCLSLSLGDTVRYLDFFGMYIFLCVCMGSEITERLLKSGKSPALVLVWTNARRQ